MSSIAVKKLTFRQLFLALIEDLMFFMFFSSYNAGKEGRRKTDSFFSHLFECIVKTERRKLFSAF
jgi:hypothetical protein